jgi:hypothetical protein
MQGVQLGSDGVHGVLPGSKSPMMLKWCGFESMHRWSRATWRCVGYSIVETNASLGTGVFGLCAEFVAKVRYGVG